MGTNSNKTKTKIKVIAFDFGGVLGSDTDAWNTNFKSMLNLLEMSTDQVEKIQSKIWIKQKIGTTSDNDFFQSLIKASLLSPKLVVIKQAYYENIQVNYSVLRIAEKLKNIDYQLVILSNEAKEFMDYKRKKFGLDKIFNKNYTSAYLGMAKPNIKIFKYVLADLQINPEELLFIDDAQTNIDAAKSIGIKTILFKNPNQLRKKLNNFL